MMRRWLLALVLGGCASQPDGMRATAFEDDLGLRRTALWAPTAQVEVVYWAEQSSQPALLLIHPWGLEHSVWSAVAPALDARYRILTLDLPGHGQSEKVEAAWSVERLAAAVVDLLDDAGIERVMLVGNSLGGATSLEVARRIPERVTRLVLIGAPGGAHYPEGVRRLARTAATPSSLGTLSPLGWQVGLAVGAGRNRYSEAHTRGLLERRTHEAEWRAFSRAAPRLLHAVVRYVPELDRVTAPALVVHGGWDPLIPASHSEALAQRLPHGSLVRLEDCGHLPQLECPEELLGVLEPFLSGSPVAE